MQVIMLGWEFPPHISGGLGTACFGMTQALSRQGVSIDFVVPHLYGDEEVCHLNLVDPSSAFAEKFDSGEIRGIFREFKVQSYLTPYLGANRFEFDWNGTERTSTSSTGSNQLYNRDLMYEVNRYSLLVRLLSSNFSYDLIHAHDWMTFPAAVELQRQTGRPLLLHVHSLEYDRSGDRPNEEIAKIEEMGLRECKHVIAVSHYTKTIIHEKYHIPLSKISVVHNGIHPRTPLFLESRVHSQKSTKTVLFLGRITFQKGPDYFIEAAAKVLQFEQGAKFVVAGHGDMLDRLKFRTRELGIENHVSFPGFVTGSEIEQIYSNADLYVMPSVSEPFGISALEAVSYETPVIVSKQAGVSEVLQHVLKVDFWDIDRMASLMIGALKYPQLRQDMINMAREEIRKLHWDNAGVKIQKIYQDLLGAA